jgi:folate-binding protein YgfZ
MSEQAISEYRAARELCGLLDRSAHANLLVTGSDKTSWLQGMVSNDVQMLAERASRIQACILDATGHMLADLAIVNHPAGLLLDFDRMYRGKVFDLLNKFIITEDVEIIDRTEDLSCFSLQGPGAVDIAKHLPADAFESMAPADHTGLGGLDIYVPSSGTSAVFELLTTLGAVPMGDEAADVFRLEAGIPKYGVDMDESTIPLEAGLEATHISYTKGCYVGQEIVARIQSRGHTNRALTGFLVDGDINPANGDRVLSSNATIPGDAGYKDVGWITSAVTSLSLNRPIALGYLRHEYRTAGTKVQTDAGLGLEVTYLPIVPRAT